MIVLLSCSINSLANSKISGHISSTGEVINRNDSILISYDDLRLANSKLIQLEYEKDINSKLRNVINNDSIIINDYKTINAKITKDYKKAIRQRNMAIGGALVFLISTIVLCFK